MNVNFQFTAAAGGALLPETTLLLSYAGAGGAERIVSQPVPAGGKVSLDTQTATECLLRMRVFAPPADLVFDKCFQPGYAWPPAMTIMVREAKPSRVLRFRAEPMVRLGLLHHSPITVVQGPRGQLPQIQGLRTGGGPGELSLPVEIHRVLIPPSQKVGSISASPDPAPVRFAAPAPQVQPPVVKDTPRPARLRTVPVRRGPLTLLRPLTGVFPSEQVRLQSVEQHPWGALATIELWPVQYDYDSKEYVYHPNLAYDLATTPTAGPGGQTLFPGITNRDQAGMLTSLLHAGAVSAIGSVEPWTVDPASTISAAPAGMVIITDDTTWNGTNLATVPFLGSSEIIKGTAPPQNSWGNGLIAEFERLAYWKTSRGMRTKVMPISKIVALYNAGDLAAFLPGPAADLAEVIRAFIQYAVKNWQTTFVLIGGDQTIVPMRQVLGQRDADYLLDGNSAGNDTIEVLPGPPGQWIAKISGAVTAGDLAENPQPITSSFSLVCTTTGVVLPYSATGTGDRGWFFTVPYNFGMVVSGFTVQGPPDADGTLAVIAFGGPEIQDGSFAWVWPGRATQTDHYYSDMTRARDSCRDFDASGNLLLGQTVSNGDIDESLDGMQVTGSVYVGRAPVTNATDARSFVEKVIGYEQVRAVDAPPIDPSYLEELILYADNWAHPWDWTQGLGAGATPKPSFFVWSGSDVLVQLQNDGVDANGNPAGLAADLAKADILQPLPYSMQLLFDQSGDIIDIPYDASGVNTPCWFFCDATYTRLAPSAGTLGTAFVRIANAPIDFSGVFWQFDLVDYASAQKERLHAMWKTWFPALGDVRRIYRDAPDLPDQDIESMSTETANAALDQGSHFFSVSGHGNINTVNGDISNRTCGNAGRPYIMYVHSCLTADPDAQPSLGACFVAQTNGALAYVGYARCCNTADVVADYELGFWCGVASTRRLGPPIACHINASGWEHFDHIFQMTLYGDPEMPVWIAPPRQLTVQFSQSVEPSGPGIGCQYVSALVTDDQGQPVPGLIVTAIQGWQNSLTDPAAYVTATTDDTGYAGLLLSTAITDAVRVVVSTPPSGMSALYAPAIQDYAPQRSN